MNVVKITLINNLNANLKKRIFNAIRQSGIYEMADELLKESEITESDFFEFKHITDDYHFKLQFISDGKCLKISSDFLDDGNVFIDFENEIKAILADSRIKILMEKNITLDKLNLILQQYKNKINFKSCLYKLIGGIITTIGFATGFRGMKFMNISWPFIIIGIGIIIGLIFLGWTLHISKNIETKVLSDPEKEAKRIFDELKEY